MKIPKGQERSGIKVKCPKCDRHVTETCPLTQKRISTCKYKENHKFHLICHVPDTRNDRISKISEAQTFNQALLERAKFVEDLKKNNYHKIAVEKEVRPKTNLFDLTIEYLNAISGESKLEILNRKRSKDHVGHIRKVLTRFSECMTIKGFTVTRLDVKDIGDIQANDFLLYLKDYSDSKDLCNKHFVAMKTFFNWVIEVKEYKISNPFRKAVLKIERKRQAEVVTKEEFEALLKTVTYENGYSAFKNPSGKQKGKNLYREYLASAFKLALETGCRGEELAVLKWSHIRTLSEGVELFDITNLKVTRIQASNGTKIYKRPIPITKSLKRLLIELGYHSKKGKDEHVLERPTGLSDLHMTKLIGRAFNHYIKLVDTGGRKIEFKDLRKTYFTFITLKLGTNAKLFTGHADEKVLEDHYLAKQFIAGDLTDFSVFGEPVEEYRALKAG